MTSLAWLRRANSLATYRLCRRAWTSSTASIWVRWPPLPLRRRAIVRMISPPPVPHDTGLPPARASCASLLAAAAGIVPAGTGSPLQLIAAAAVPVAKVALFCAVGAWAANRGLLSPDGRRTISALTLHIFTPCLLFSKLAVGVGLGEVGRLWVVSANIMASHIVGLLLGVLAVRLARVPYRLRNQVVLSCGVGNVGNLPFVLLAGLAVDPALPFAAALGPAAASELAMRYVALSNFIATLIQFPLAFVFLQKPPPQQEQELQQGEQQEQPSKQLQQELKQQEQHPKVSRGGTVPSAAAAARATETAAVKPTTSCSAAESSSSGADAVPFAASDYPAATVVMATSPGSPNPSPPPPSISWRGLLAGMLSPPSVASIAGVGVASVVWLKSALYSPSGSLRLVGEVVDALGAVCIPALLLVLGANLSRGPGVAAGKLPPGSVVAAGATRLVLLPAVCGTLLIGVWRAGLLPAGTDPLALLVMLVMHATPTAVLVHSMATLFGYAEDEVAALLFWQYAASMATLPLAIGAMLAAVGPAAGTYSAWLRPA